MRYDQRMPSILRKRMLDIEISLLSHLAWRKNSSISMIIQSVDSDKENENSSANSKEKKIKHVHLFHGQLPLSEGLAAVPMVSETPPIVPWTASFEP